MTISYQMPKLVPDARNVFMFNLGPLIQNFVGCSSTPCAFFSKNLKFHKKCPYLVFTMFPISNSFKAQRVPILATISDCVCFMTGTRKYLVFFSVSGYHSVCVSRSCPHHRNVNQSALLHSLASAESCLGSYDNR